MNRLVVVAPLREGAYEAAKRLLSSGPPFDLEDTPYDRHWVFLTRGEAVFVFEGPGPQTAFRLGAERPELWHAVEAWNELLADSPRIAETQFAWSRAEAHDDVSFEATPGPGDSDGGDVYAP